MLVAREPEEARHPSRTTLSSPSSSFPAPCARGGAGPPSDDSVPHACGVLDPDGNKKVWSVPPSNAVLADTPGEPDLELGVDVELEADAESLASSESEEGSEDNVVEAEYFRFSRLGLSIAVDLPVLTACEPSDAVLEKSCLSSDSITQDRGKDNGAFAPQCVIIDFEKECRSKYPPEYPIGCKVGRFSRATNPIVSPSVAASDCTGLVPAAFGGAVAGPTLLSQRAGSNQKGTSSFSLSSSTSAMPHSALSATSNTPFLGNQFSEPYEEDRLSMVIQDILHRLNRQGALADPRDVCRKGGGRSGDYYDNDDEFFDDSLTFEMLGLPDNAPSPGFERCRRSARSVRGKARDRSPSDSEMEKASTRSTRPHGGNNSGAGVEGHDTGDDATDTENEDEGDDEEEEDIFYEYVDPGTFTMDNDSANDDVVLWPEEEEGSDQEDDDTSASDTDTTDTEGSSALSVNGDADDTNSIHLTDTDEAGTIAPQKKKRPLLSTKFWVRRKAWRSLEPKLHTDVVVALSKLEKELQGKGSQKGLYVSPHDIVCLCQETVKEVFTKFYPNVAWDTAEFLALTCGEGLQTAPAGAGSGSAPTASRTTLPLVGSTRGAPAASTTNSLRGSCEPILSSSHSKLISNPNSILKDNNGRNEEVKGEQIANALLFATTDSSSQNETTPALGASPPPVQQASLASTSSKVEITPSPANDHKAVVLTDNDSARPSGGSTFLSVSAPVSTTTSTETLSVVAPPKAPSGKAGQPGAEKKQKRHPPPLAPATFRNTVTMEDIVPLTCPALKQLGDCLTLMTSAVTSNSLKRWFTMRLVIHNQVVYTALEDRLFGFITKRSPLFRTKGSYFFRSLKKAVDQYLKALASSSASASSTSSSGGADAHPSCGAKLKTTNSHQSSGITAVAPGGVPSSAISLPNSSQSNSSTEDQKQQSLSNSANKQLIPNSSGTGSGGGTGTSSTGATPPASASSSSTVTTGASLPDTPFAPIAAELLNWAVVYNCRRHELRELGETFDEWTAGFASYAAGILNISIQRRREGPGSVGDATSASTGASGGSNNANGPVAHSTTPNKKTRVWVPTKFLEESLNKLKQHFSATTLYERRSRRPLVPQFITPCKGLNPPSVRLPRQAKPSSTGSGVSAPTSTTALVAAPNASNLAPRLAGASSSNALLRFIGAKGCPSVKPSSASADSGTKAQGKTSGSTTSSYAHVTSSPSCPVASPVLCADGSEFQAPVSVSRLAGRSSSSSSSTLEIASQSKAAAGSEKKEVGAVLPTFKKRKRRDVSGTEKNGTSDSTTKTNMPRQTKPVAAVEAVGDAPLSTFSSDVKPVADNESRAIPITATEPEYARSLPRQSLPSASSSEGPKRKRKKQQPQLTQDTGPTISSSSGAPTENEKKSGRSVETTNSLLQSTPHSEQPSYTSCAVTVSAPALTNGEPPKGLASMDKAPTSVPLILGASHEQNGSAAPGSRGHTAGDHHHPPRIVQQASHPSPLQCQGAEATLIQRQWWPPSNSPLDEDCEIVSSCLRDSSQVRTTFAGSGPVVLPCDPPATGGTHCRLADGHPEDGCSVGGIASCPPLVDNAHHRYPDPNTTGSRGPQQHTLSHKASFFPQTAYTAIERESSGLSQFAPPTAVPPQLVEPFSHLPLHQPAATPDKSSPAVVSTAFRFLPGHLHTSHPASQSGAISHGRPVTLPPPVTATSTGTMRTGPTSEPPTHAADFQAATAAAHMRAAAAAALFYPHFSAVANSAAGFHSLYQHGFSNGVSDPCRHTGPLPFSQTSPSVNVSNAKAPSLMRVTQPAPVSTQTTTKTQASTSQYISTATDTKALNTFQAPRPAATQPYKSFPQP